MTETAPTPPVMSVVVMGYRNGATIVDAVRSLLDQASGFVGVDVVVVTSGGDDSTARLARHLPSVTVIDHPGRLLPGATRNAGVAASTGSIVAFLAGDCRAEPGWIEARLAAHGAGAAVVAGAVTNGGPARPWAWASYFDLFSARGPGRPAGPVRFPDPAAHGLSYERPLLDRLGPFDESVRVGEDTLLARQLADLGIDVWFEPAVCAAHVGPDSTRKLLREHNARGARRARAEAARLRPVTATRAVLVSGVVWARWLATRVARSWTNAPDQRGRLVVSLPWLALARAAYVAGWYRERIRNSRQRPSSDEPTVNAGRSPNTPRATS